MTPNEPAAAEATARRPSLLASLLDSLGQGRAMVAEVLELASLETRLAALSMVEMTALAVGIALLGFSVWVLVLAAIAGGLIAAGVAWPWALLILAVLAGLGVWLSIRRIRKLSENLRFAATRNVLAPPRPATETSYADPGAAVAVHH